MEVGRLGLGSSLTVWIFSVFAYLRKVENNDLELIFWHLTKEIRYNCKIGRAEQMQKHAKNWLQTICISKRRENNLPKLPTHEKHLFLPKWKCAVLNTYF